MTLQHKHNIAEVWSCKLNSTTWQIAYKFKIVLSSVLQNITTADIHCHVLSEGNVIAAYSETQESEDNTDNSAKAIAWISLGTITYKKK